MPREDHLNTLHALVDAAYDAGTITQSVENKGGREHALRVSFTVPQSQSSHIRDPRAQDAFKRAFDAARVAI